MNDYIRIPCIGKGELHIHPTAHINRTLKVKGFVYIGPYTTINENIEIYGGKIVIGGYTSIARNVVIQTVNHDMTKPGIDTRFYRKVFKDTKLPNPDGPVNIGNSVWIGTKSIILTDVNIGNGAVVAAGSIVTKDVESYSIVGGVPAKHIKYRFEKKIRDFLDDIQWWNWDIEKIKRNEKFFGTDLTKVDDLYGLLVE